MEYEPRVERATMPRGYEQPSGAVPPLPWSHAVEQLERAENYWLATVSPDGRPHVTPVWGAWVEGALYFDGIPTARWARNLAANPALSVHLESGKDVVILEGDVEDLETDPELGDRIVEAWEAKYQGSAPQPATRGIFRIRPRSARGWTQFPEDAIRWSFGER